MGRKSMTTRPPAFPSIITLLLLFFIFGLALVVSSPLTPQFPGDSESLLQQHVSSRAAPPTSGAPVPVGGLATVNVEGGTFEIDFDVDTDRAGLSGVFSCSSIFESAVTLGNQSLCLWRDARSLIVRFSQTATIAGGGQLTLLTGIIGSLADPTEYLTDAASRTVVVTLPESPLPPTVVIEGTSAVGWCDVLTLDGSASYGSGGRAFVGGYVWGLVPPTDNSTDVVAGVVSALASQRGPVVSLDGPTLKFNTTRVYNFSLTLQNWLGVSATAYYPVEIIATDQVIVRIAGGNPTIHSGTTLSLRGIVDPPCICQRDQSLEVCNTTTSYSYAWVRTGGPVFALDLNSRTSSSLYIPAGALRGGYTYRFTLTATNADLLTYVGQATVAVTVLAEPLQAVVHSGTRYVSRYATIELDGSASFDPNGADGDLSYSWSCLWEGNVDLYYGDSCPAARYLDTAAYQTASIVLPASVLPPGDWRFTLTVTKGNLSATDDQLVTIAWKDAPTVFVRLADLGDNVNHTYYDLPSNVMLRFTASVDSPLGRVVGDLAWTLTSSDVSLNGSGVVQGGTGTTALAFNSDVLTPGAEYVLRFTALYETDSLEPNDWAQSSGLPWAASTLTEAGWAEVTFSIGAFPWGGSCSVDPATPGVPYSTVFTAQCVGFDTVYGVVSGPIFVHYYIRHSEDELGGLFPLGSHTSVAAGRFQTYLPSTGTGSLALYARVFDRSGSTAYYDSATSGNRLLEVASSIVVSTKKRSHIEAASAVLNGGVTNEYILRGRVDLVPTLLYSVLIDVNYANTSTDFQVNPFEDPSERDLRVTIFDVLRNQLALEQSADSTTVQAQLIYLITGGLRPPSTTSSPSPSPLPSPSPSPSASPSPSSLSRRRAVDVLQSTVAGGSKRTTGFDLGVEALTYLQDLVAGSVGSSDRIYIANAASNILEYYKAYTLDPVGFSNDVIDLVLSLALDQASNSVLGSQETWDTPAIKVSIFKYPANELPANISAGGVNVGLPREDLSALLGSGEVEVTLCTYFTDPLPAQSSATSRRDLRSTTSAPLTLMAPVVILSVRSAGGDVSFLSLQQNLTISYPVVLSENPHALTVANVTSGGYNASCRSWSGSGWAVTCSQAGSAIASASGTTCVCSGFTSGLPLSVAAISTAVSPSPSPIIAAVTGSSSDSNVKWILLAIFVAFAIGVLFLILFGFRLYKKGKESQEDEWEIPVIPQPPSEPEPEPTATDEPADQSKQDMMIADEPPEPLNLPSDTDSEASVVLHRPKFYNNRIVFEHDDSSRGSPRRRSRSRSRSTRTRTSRSRSRSRSPSSRSRSRGSRSNSSYDRKARSGSTSRSTRTRSESGHHSRSRSPSTSRSNRSSRASSKDLSSSRGERSGEDFSSEEERGKAKVDRRQSKLIKGNEGKEKDEEERRMKESRDKEEDLKRRKREDDDREKQRKEKDEEEGRLQRKMKEDEEEVERTRKGSEVKAGSKIQPRRKPEEEEEDEEEDDEDEDEQTDSQRSARATESDDGSDREDAKSDRGSRSRSRFRSGSRTRSRSRSLSRSPHRSDRSSDGERGRRSGSEGESPRSRSHSDRSSDEEEDSSGGSDNDNP